MYYFNPTSNGFLHSTIHKNIPEDCIQLSDGQHDALLSDMAAGKILTVVDGAVTAIAPEITNDQIVKAFTYATQQWLDTTAQSYNYDDITSAVSYADEPSVPAFQAEGQSFRAWRSLVWDYHNQRVDAFNQSTITELDFTTEQASFPQLSI